MPARSVVPGSFPALGRRRRPRIVEPLHVGDGDLLAQLGAKADYRFDLGRYWTTHLKTDVAMSASNPWHAYERRSPVPGMTGRAFAYIDSERQLFAIAPAITWQFRENTLMHPYVSGGVKMDVLREHRHRDGVPYRPGSPAYAVPPVEERRHVGHGAPFRRRRLQVLHLAIGVRAHRRTSRLCVGRRPPSVGGLGVGVDF